MSELLIVRALRYQWKIVLGVFLCSLLAAHAARTLFVGQHADVSAHTTDAAPVPQQPVPVTTQPLAVVVPQPVNADAVNAKQMQRWRAGIRYLDARIEEARAALQNADPTARVPEAGTPSEVKAERPAPASPSLEEIALRKSVADQRHRLEMLRAIDTDMHPDVIEATDRLDRLESQLALLERRQAREHSGVSANRPALGGQARPAIDSDTPPNEMTHLSDLIRQRAYFVTQIQRAAAASNTTVPAPEAELMPLLGSSVPAEQPAMDATPKPSHAPSRVRFELVAAALSALLAFVIASWREASQDHIAGPTTLCAALPEGVAFLGTVPRMRQQ